MCNRDGSPPSSRRCSRLGTGTLLLAMIGGLAGVGCGSQDTGSSALRAMGGQARFFDVRMGMLQEVSGEGAEAFVLEDPTRHQTLPADGRFRFEGLPEGSEVTLAIRHPNFQPTLTATLTVGASDATDITFQVVTHTLANLAGLLLGVDPEDPTLCEMATTVAAVTDHRWDLFAPGEPGATVQVEPASDHGRKIIYFDEHTVPNPRITETTTDGGVVLVGAPPGIYFWTATKAGRVFNRLKMKCVAGWLTNASPPWGLQAVVAP